jgi:hypothetical protein
MRLKLSHLRQTWKNHEAKFPINKITINKISMDEIEKESFNKKISKVKQIAIKRIKIKFKIKIKLNFEECN